MTERYPTSPREPAPQAPRPPRARAPARGLRPGPGAVIWGSVASFAVLFGFLTNQLRSGNDPALGASVAKPAGKPQKALVRKVIKRRIVATPVPKAAGGSTGSGLSSGPSATPPSAPVVTATAPVPVAPAPVTTGAS